MDGVAVDEVPELAEVPDAVLDGLAVPVAAAIPLVIARIPKDPAAELGRLRAIADGTWPVGGSSVMHRAWFGVRTGEPGDSPVRDALDSLPSLLIERLLGALELTVPEVDLSGAPDLSGFLGEPFTGEFWSMTMDGTSEAINAAAKLDRVRPGAVPLVAALARRLAAHSRIASLLSVDPELIEEREMSAAHGAALLALAVSTATAVLHRVGVRSWAIEPPAVLGVAIGTAVLLLRDTPMPPGYDAALLVRSREDYRLPLGAGGSAPVSGHRFALLEAGDVPDADFSGNGLVAVLPNGVVIRTGAETGHVRVSLNVLEAPPPDVDTAWEEIVEVSWPASEGGASVAGAVEPHLRKVTPPWPDDYRVRVHARGRDDADETECYELVVWQAPAAPETVHARTDQLGHRQRGEREPARPEIAYRWLGRSGLSEAATITVVTGLDVADVLRAFGADPAKPESLKATDPLADPWVAVLDIGEAVLAVEHNGWQGSTAPVLTRASAAGRAGSMYWNVNAVTRLSFAENGEVLLSEEPIGDLDAPSQLTAALADLDFADVHRRKPTMGMVAVQRFTGHGVTAEDLARIEAADVAYRIVPDLPTLYPRRPGPGSPLGPAAETLPDLPEPTLRDLAWWAATEAARYADLAEDPDIVASIAAQALTRDAHLRARYAQLADGENRWTWLALHRATNPDPLAAATDAIDAARHAAGPQAATLIADAQARITGPTTP